MSVDMQYNLKDVMSLLSSANVGNVLDLCTLDGKPSGALVRPGEYVLYSECPFYPEIDRSTLLVGQVIEISDKRDISLEGFTGDFWLSGEVHSVPSDRDRFLLLRRMKLNSGREKLSSELYPYVPDSLLEVQRTSVLHWIDARSILAISFVFHIDQVNQCLYSCSGIRNAFIIRKEVDIDGSVTDIKQDDFNPFFMPNFHESYSKRMWNWISSTLEMCWRSMTTSKSQWDGRTKHVHFPGANLECMLYLKHMMELLKTNGSTPLCEDKMTATRAKKVCHANLSVSHKKRKFEVSLLRVVEEFELDLIRSIFGSTFGVGLTHSAPSMAAIKTAKETIGKDISTVELQDHQVVRIVTCREDELDECPDKDTGFDSEDPYDRSPPQKRLIPFPGCDFFFEQSTITNFHVAL